MQENLEWPTLNFVNFKMNLPPNIGCNLPARFVSMTPLAPWLFIKKNFAESFFAKIFCAKIFFYQIFFCQNLFSKLYFFKNFFVKLFRLNFFVKCFHWIAMAQVRNMIFSHSHHHEVHDDVALTYEIYFWNFKFFSFLTPS